MMVCEKRFCVVEDDFTRIVSPLLTSCVCEREFVTGFGGLLSVDKSELLCERLGLVFRMT
jgi:hypothetical protein